MMEKHEQDTWCKVNIRQSKLERISKLVKTHPEYDSVSDFIDQIVTLALDKMEGGRKN
jgi:Arc/MetJ-type ribon-helix-helix transcriptional regulator